MTQTKTDELILNLEEMATELEKTAAYMRYTAEQLKLEDPA
jgi:hypothetical protein